MPGKRRHPSDPPRRPPRGTLTYEKFLEWCDENTLAEWIGGKVEMASPASLRHQDRNALLVTILRIWVEVHDLGKVLPAPFQMHLPEPINRGREPDLGFVPRPHFDRLHDTYLERPADLVVEITSPESFDRDHATKFSEYERARIPEYWLLDPLQREATFNQLGPGGRYRAALIDADGVDTSPVRAGFRLPVHWLWQAPLPGQMAALRAPGLVP